MKTINLRLLRLITVLLFSCGSFAWRYEQTLHDSAQSPSYGRVLGDSLVDFDGTVAIVTANDTCTTLLHSGSTYSEWIAEEYPLPYDPNAEIFVQSARYNGRLLVVGAASRSGEYDGRLYVYHIGSKKPEVIYPPFNDTEQTRYFGTVVATAAISRHFAVALPSSDKVVVYENSTAAHGAPMQEVAILQAPVGYRNTNEKYHRVFGLSLAMSDNILVVGAPVVTSAVNNNNDGKPGEDDVVPDGILFTFYRNETWSSTASVLDPRKLFPEEPPMPLFGYAIDITKDGTRMVVTVPCIEPPILTRPIEYDMNDDKNAKDSGSAVSSSSEEACTPIAFIFIWNEIEGNWTLMYNVTAPDDARKTSFGARVSINPEEGDLLVGVGAPSENPDLSSVYMFLNGEPYARIPSVQDAYAFGNSMTMYGDILAVGVPLQAIGHRQLNGMTLITDDGDLQMGGVAMYSISQLSDNMMTLVMSLTLFFFLLLVSGVLAAYKLHPSSIAALRSQKSF